MLKNGTEGTGTSSCTRNGTDRMGNERSGSKQHRWLDQQLRSNGKRELFDDRGQPEIRNRLIIAPRRHHRNRVDRLNDAVKRANIPML